MTLVVLGWDGLDYDLVHRWDMAKDFGPVNVSLETFENPVIGKPHTYEVWPSIITGVRPEDHGIRAERYTHGGSWESRTMNVAATVSKYVVPDGLRWRIGRRIRDHGARFHFESLDYYRERGITTVFDNRQSFALAIPNARSAYDDQLGMTTDRGASLAEYIDIETGPDGETVHVPNVPLQEFATRLEADVGEKMGALRQALKWDFDLVFVWFGYLDTIGHVAPTVSDTERWVRDGYATAAAWTGHVREDWLGEDDRLFCVSDHGLKAGAHTPDAFFGRWGYEPDTSPSTVCDVAETINRSAPTSKDRDEPYSASQSKADFETVGDRLRDLGYID